MKGIEVYSKLVDFAIEHPELAPDRVLVIHGNKKEFKKILSPSRLELIEIIREKDFQSVGEVAKYVNRPVESVSRDLKILSNYGILELVRIGKRKKPVIEKDMLLIPLTT